MVVVVSGPSGCGKTTICRRICERPGYRFSVSVTTRPRRPNERDGVDYHFVAPATFQAMRERGELVEWSEHFGACYGTPRQAVNEATAAGDTVVLDIDVNGADQTRQAAPDAKRVFVAPPSREALEARLRSRGTENADALSDRLARADMEMARSGDFDLTVVNDHVDRAADEIMEWIESEAKRTNGS